MTCRRCGNRERTELAGMLGIFASQVAINKCQSINVNHKRLFSFRQLLVKKLHRADLFVSNLINEQIGPQICCLAFVLKTFEYVAG